MTVSIVRNIKCLQDSLLACEESEHRLKGLKHCDYALRHAGRSKDQYQDQMQRAREQLSRARTRDAGRKEEERRMRERDALDRDRMNFGRIRP